MAHCSLCNCGWNRDLDVIVGYPVELCVCSECFEEHFLPFLMDAPPSRIVIPGEAYLAQWRMFGERFGIPIYP